MTTQTFSVDGATSSGVSDTVQKSRQDWSAHSVRMHEFRLGEALTLPAVAESAEAVVEDLDAAGVAAPVILDCLRARPPEELDAPKTGSPDGRMQPLVKPWPHQESRGPNLDAVSGVGVSDGPAIAVDEYAKAVLYNGLGHYQAARVAALRACAREDFALIEGALAELVEASVRSGRRACAVAALRRLEARVQVSSTPWVIGVSAGARALLEDDARAERSYLEGIERLSGSRARVALGRVRLLYGEWLRRRGRRVDARQQLSLARDVFSEVGLDGFAERAQREILATGETVRKRTDDTRLDLTAQEAQIAQLASRGWTNPEIGERLFISPRTVEWHLRKVFSKLGIKSRRELDIALPRVADIAV